MGGSVAIVAGAGGELGRAVTALSATPADLRLMMDVTVAPQLLGTAKTRPYLAPDLLAHAVVPEAIADIIAYLVSAAAGPVSGAVVPAYGA